jgi:SsrA-binding protein
MKTFAINKKIGLDYEIQDKFEAGIVLYGWEVKSIRNQQISLISSYIKPFNNEIYLTNVKIKPWKFAGEQSNEQQERDRKLLLKGNEIRKINSAFKQPGLSIVPSKVYESPGKLIKIEIAIVKGRKKFDKRQKIKEKEMKGRVSQDRLKYNF